MEQTNGGMTVKEHRSWNSENVSSICITVCLLAVLLFFGLWIYWATVVRSAYEVEMMRAVGGEAWVQIQACARDVALCRR